MAAYSGFEEKDYDSVFITLDKMDKIGLEGVEKELKEAGYGDETVEKYLYLFKGMENASDGFAWLTEEIKDFLIGQCSDGLGESLEQREIRVEDGNMYVSFWQSGEDYFMLNSDEFDEYLQTLHNGMSMRGME